MLWYSHKWTDTDTKVIVSIHIKVNNTRQTTSASRLKRSGIKVYMHISEMSIFKNNTNSLKQTDLFR